MPRDEDNDLSFLRALADACNQVRIGGGHGETNMASAIADFKGRGCWRGDLLGFSWPRQEHLAHGVGGAARPDPLHVVAIDRAGVAREEAHAHRHDSRRAERSR